MPHHNHLQVNVVHKQVYLMEHKNGACNGANPQPCEACIFPSGNHVLSEKHSSQCCHSSTNQEANLVHVS